MQIAFFVSPVIWKPEQLRTAARWLPLNPFYDMLEIVRGPLLGAAPSRWSGSARSASASVLCGVSWAFFLRARGRIAFWI